MTLKHPFSTRRGRTLRAAKLHQEPRCEPCLRKGKLSLATMVHHIVPLHQGGDPLPSLDQLESQCVECHHTIHGKRTTGGCGPDGVPEWWR